jgi:uncharacterized protein YkwD
MSRRSACLLGVNVLIGFAVFSSTSVSRADSGGQPTLAGSPADLINAVNALRASYGLAPYSLNSILMYTAQSQADFLAATGSMTHAGPGGIGLTERLLAAGYPLAGDLSLGGFRAENITGGVESMSAQTAVERWTGDAPHLNTMISPNLSEIGAGVAVSGGRVYYVIDCALPTTSGAPRVEAATLVEGGSAAPGVETIMIPVTLSTPDAEGNVIHEVKPGQTLWQIAIAYEVKIDEIKGFNNLFDNSIYPGDRLLIKRGVVGTVAVPTQTLTQAVTSSFTAVPSSTADRLTSTTVPAVMPASTDNSAIMKVAIGLIALAILGGGIFAWLVNPKNA